MHKTLLAAYATTPDTWRRWCVDRHGDGLPRAQPLPPGKPRRVRRPPEGGEYKNAAIPDGEKQSITAGTKGRIIAITRQTIINDDMGALNDIATRLGRAAR
jgi:hypothetical protein